MFLQSCSCSVAPWGHCCVLASPKKRQNCRTCSRDCGPAWHGPSSVRVSVISDILTCYGQHQCTGKETNNRSDVQAVTLFVRFSKQKAQHIEKERVCQCVCVCVHVCVCARERVADREGSGMFASRTLVV